MLCAAYEMESVVREGCKVFHMQKMFAFKTYRVLETDSVLLSALLASTINHRKVSGQCTFVILETMIN